MEHVQQLLETLAVRSDGVGSEEAAQILGAASPKGIGSRLSEAKSELAGERVAWDDVVERRHVEGASRWFAGPRIERARHILSGYLGPVPHEPVESDCPRPVLVFRTLVMEESARVFPDGVADLPRQVDRQAPGTTDRPWRRRGEVHIERIENAKDGEAQAPQGCDEHGYWVRGRYDDELGLEETGVEALATRAVVAEFGVASVWEKRVALGPDPRAQLAAEQAWHHVHREDGWRPVPNAPIHRYAARIWVDGEQVKIPPEVALRARYRLGYMEGEDRREIMMEALRGDAFERVTEEIRRQYETHHRMCFLSYEHGGGVEWPMSEEQAETLITPLRITGKSDDGSRDWTFEHAPRFESDLIDYAIEVGSSGEHRRAELILQSVLRANPRQIEALTCLGSLAEHLGHQAEASALFAEAVYQGRSVIPEEFDWQQDRLEWGWIANRPVQRAWYNLARLRAWGGAEQEAIDLWEDLLRMSPNDNIGARIGLMNHLISTGRFSQAVALAQRDRNDVTPEIRLGEAIARAHRGEDLQAREAATCAIRYRTGERLAARIVRGDATEWTGGEYEEDFWESVRGAWNDDTGQRLRTVLKELVEGKLRTEPNLRDG